MSDFRHISLLLIEDNLGDAELVQNELHSELLVSYDVTHVHSLALAIDALGKERFDAILLDLDLEDSFGLNTLKIISESAPNLPIIVLSGHDDMETGLGAMHAGAQDFLVKGHADGIQLRRSILFAEHHKRLNMMLEGILRQNELILKSVGDGIAGLDSMGRVTFTNPRLQFMTGWTAEDLMMKSPDDVFHPIKLDDSHAFHGDSPISATLQTGHTHEMSDILIRCKSGHLLPVDLVVTPILENGFLEGAVAAYHDARDRHQALELLSHQLGFQQQVMDALPIPVFYLDGMDVLIGCNQAFHTLAGRGYHGLIGIHAHDVLPKPISEAVALACQTGPSKRQVVVAISDGDGPNCVVKLSRIFGKDASIIGMVGIIEESCSESKELLIFA